MAEKEMEKLVKQANSIFKLFGKCKEFVDLQNDVINSQNPELIYMFAVGVEGADIPALQKALQETCSLKYMLKFAQEVKDADVEEMSRVVAADKFPVFYYLIGFAELPGADRYALAKAIADTGDIDYIVKFSLILHKGDEEAYALISSVVAKYAVKYNDGALAYRFLKRSPSIFSKFMIDALVKIGDPKFLYLASQLPEIEMVYDLQALQEAMVKTGSFEYVEKLAENVGWADKVYLYKNLAKVYKEKNEELEG